ncbi:MAG: diguanylate cyclase [Gammaproteobacteria bacterium]|nr:diguanylate cyclase [Gammaproteobacteria bacterium]MBU1776649.1 diguanylate cyclase [Gammaproteobacteria bacterium]MBU1970044.1 diguanylate cyclase [Gammaproteobacteria bacterium]
MRILFVGIPADNVARVLRQLHADGAAPVHLRADSMADLDELLLQRWDVLLTAESEVHPLKELIQILHKRDLDIPIIVVADFPSLTLGEAMNIGVQDYLSSSQLDRLLPTMQREMVAAILRSNLREQVVTDYLMKEIDQLILLGYDLPYLNDRICSRMVELFDLKLVWIGARMPDGVVQPVASAGQSAYLEGIEVRWDDTPQGNGPVGRAIRGNKPESLKADSPMFKPWRARAETFAMRDILAMPLGIKGEVVGALVMYSGRDDAFDKLTVSRLSAFAGRVTVAMLGAQEQQELRLMHVAMSNAANAMFITRRDGIIEWLNEALSRFSGYSMDELTGANPRIFNSGQHDNSYWAEMWASILRGEPWRGDVVNRNRNGELYTVSQSVSPLFNEQGELTHFLAVQQDISEKKRLEEEIRHLAYHDPLTQLPNRMLFRDRVQQAIVQAHRSGHRLAVMFIDLDGFKAVNDLHGHSSGDCLLQEIAARTKLCIRSGDTVARLGGDEFTTLLHDVGDRESIERVARKLLDAAMRSCELGSGIAASVSFSIGISVYPDDGDSFDALLSHADQAMYEAKQGGKNRYVFYRGT